MKLQADIKIKTITTISINRLLKSAILWFFVENPPVDTVVKA
jgi:hypothetical protein